MLKKIATILLIAVIMATTSMAAVFAAPAGGAGGGGGTRADIEQAKQLADAKKKEEEKVKAQTGSKIDMSNVSKEQAEGEEDEFGYSEEKKASKNYTNSDNMRKKMLATKGHYAFSIEESDALFGGISLAAGVNAISNIVFGISKSAIQFAANMTNWAVSFKMYGILKDFITSSDGPLAQITSLGSDVLSNHSKGIGALVWLGVIFSLFSIVLMFARRQIAGAFGKFFSIILIMVLISSYLVLPQQFLDVCQQLTNEIGNSLLNGDSKDKPGEKAAEAIWLMGVDLPWQELETGYIKAKLEDGGALKISDNAMHQWMDIDPSERTVEGASSIFKGSVKNSIVDRMEDNTSTQAARVGETFLVLILDVLLAVLFCVLSAVALGFQIGGMLMWIIGFFVLILALFPTHGAVKIKDWAGTLAMTYFGQIVVYVIILFVTTIMSAFYSLNNIVQVFGAMLGIAAGVFLMKSQLGRLFTGTFTSGTESVAGGVVDMGRIAKERAKRTVGGYKGDSTERLMPSPIRANREARRQVKKEMKMDEYRAKAQQKKAKQQAKVDRSLTRATAKRVKDKTSHAIDSATAPVRNKMDQAKADKSDFAGDIQNRGIRESVAAKTHEREVRKDMKQARANEAAARSEYEHFNNKIRQGDNSPETIRKRDEARAKIKAAQRDDQIARRELNGIQQRKELGVSEIKYSRRMSESAPKVETKTVSAPASPAPTKIETKTTTRSTTATTPPPVSPQPTIKRPVQVKETTAQTVETRPTVKRPVQVKETTVQTVETKPTVKRPVQVKETTVQTVETKPTVKRQVQVKETQVQTTETIRTVKRPNQTTSAQKVQKTSRKKDKSDKSKK